MIKCLNIYIFKTAVFSEYIRIVIVMFSKRIARTLGGLGSEVLDGMRGSVMRTISRDFSGGRKTVLITGASRGIEYAITKLITNTLDSPAVYGTSRNSAEQLTDLIRCVRHNNLQYCQTPLTFQRGGRCREGEVCGIQKHGGEQHGRNHGAQEPHREEERPD